MKEREAEPATRSDLATVATVVVMFIAAAAILTMLHLETHFSRIEKGLQPCQITQPK